MSSLARPILSKALRTAAKSAASVNARTFASLPDFILDAPTAAVSSLPNGVRCVSENTGGDVTTVSVIVDVGSRDELSATNGIANLTQVCAMKATASRSSEKMASDIAALGGNFSGTTTKEKTIFSATVLKSDVKAAVDILGDMVQSASFPDAEVSCAAEGIAAQIALSKKYPEVALDELLMDCAYLDTPLGKSTLGSMETVGGLRPNDLKEFAQAKYTGPKIVVSAAGAVPGDLAGLIEGSAFGKVQNDPSAPSAGSASIPAPLSPTTAKAMFTGSDIRIRFDSYPHAHIAFAYETPGYSPVGEHSLVLMLLQTILGAWEAGSLAADNSASRLCREVAERNNCKSIAAFNHSFKDTGLFGVKIATTDTNCEDSMWYALDNITRIPHELTDSEVLRAKEQLQYYLLSEVDSSASTSQRIGQQVLQYGRVIGLAELVTKIDKITTNDCKKVARQYLYDQDHALAAVGPVFELPDYNWIRRRSYWLRY